MRKLSCYPASVRSENSAFVATHKTIPGYLSGFKYRFNSPQRVIAEVTTVINDYGAKFFSFADDNFVVRKDRTREICNLLIERGFHKTTKWLCQTRADAVDEPLLELMREAGCEYISFGIETGTQRLLDLIGKSVKIETIKTSRV